MKERIEEIWKEIKIAKKEVRMKEKRWEKEMIGRIERLEKRLKGVERGEEMCEIWKGELGS